MSNEHQHDQLTGAALHRAIADAIDAGEGPEAFEHWAHATGRWSTHTTFDGLVAADSHGIRIRRKPKTCCLIDAAGVQHEWPESLREEPADGTNFWLTFDDDMQCRKTPLKWRSWSIKCLYWLAQGRCHSTRKARDAHEAALLAANLGGKSQ